MLYHIRLEKSFTIHTALTRKSYVLTKFKLVLWVVESGKYYFQQLLLFHELYKKLINKKQQKASFPFTLRSNNIKVSQQFFDSQCNIIKKPNLVD